MSDYEKAHIAFAKELDAEHARKLRDFRAKHAIEHAVKTGYEAHRLTIIDDLLGEYPDMFYTDINGMKKRIETWKR